MTFGPTDSAGIVAQVAAKAATDIVVARINSGEFAEEDTLDAAIAATFGDTIALVTEGIVEQAKVVLASEFFGAVVENSSPARGSSTRSSASGKPLPSRGSSSRSSSSRSSGNRSSGGSRGKTSYIEWEAPSGITVISKEGESGPDFADADGYDGLDALPDADCYECGGTKVWDNRPSHEHFGGEGKASRPYFKCADKDCNGGNPAAFWPPKDD
jgi:hypothetical protein